MKVEESQQWPKFVEMWQTLSKLRQVQDPHHKLGVAASTTKGLKDVKSTVEYDFKTALIDLLKWLRKNGAKIDGAVPELEEVRKPNSTKPPKYKAILSIAPANAIEGNGVFVTKDTPNDEILIQVPRSLFMTTESIEDSIILKDMLREDLIADIGSIQLAIKLIYERYKSHSEWECYIKALPRTYHTVYYWSLEQIERIKGNQALFQDVIKIITLSVRAYYEAYLAVFVHEMMRKELFTYDTWIWALSSVYSRQNAVPALETIESAPYKAAVEVIKKAKEDAAAGKEVDVSAAVGALPPPKSVLALIPGFDMFNHEPGPATSDFIYEDNGLVLKAMKPMKAGEQAYMNYGARPNSELMLQQGFVPNTNPSDYALFSMTLPESDSLREAKKAALEKAGLTFELKKDDKNALVSSYTVHLPLVKGQLAPATLLYFRVLACNDAATLKDETAITSSLNNNLNSPLHAATEAQARQFYRLKCLQLLNAIPDNLVPKEDEIKKSSPHNDEQTIDRVISLYLISQHKLISSNLAIIESLQKF